jgi:hypothetical protein
VTHLATAQVYRPPEFGTWAPERQRAWTQFIPRDPNMYYFKYLPPGVAPCAAKTWSDEERGLFMDMLEVRCCCYGRRS